MTCTILYPRPQAPEREAALEIVCSARRIERVS